MKDNKLLYSKVKDLLYTLSGITLADNKDIMISNRLEKLIYKTKFNGSISELIEKVSKGSYRSEFINTFTTNKTNFFREEFHFDDLRNRVLKENNSNLKIYSCASSTGEEPYSIAMTLLEYKCSNSKIIATDIDTNVLKKASKGIYKYDKALNEFPSWIKLNKYFKRKVKSNEYENLTIKINDNVKDIVTYAKMNLNDDTYPFNNNEFDVIFCRNVLIYFSYEDQLIILKKIFRHLKIGGTLYLGHSESPQDLINYTKKIGQNIYIKTSEIL